jgi:hypothetical protein
MKICTKCKLELSLSSFFKDAQKKDGLTSRCKNCHAITKGHVYGIGKRVHTPIGSVFGRLTVIGERWDKEKPDAIVKCICVCGIEKEFRRTALKSGGSKSCGCLKKEMMSAKGTHYSSESILYLRWAGMKQRCGNPKHKNYDRYGARGIHVCEEWLKDFSVFKKWAESNGFERGLELDRIDNNSGYTPDNCRWVNHQINCCNRIHYSMRVE